jgi:hypothetical protein
MQTLAESWECFFETFSHEENSQALQMNINLAIIKE